MEEPVTIFTSCYKHGADCMKDVYKDSIKGSKK